MDGSGHLLLPLAGLLLGLAFGAVVQRSDWCARGAIADIRLMGDWRRMRSWLLAIATATLLSQAMAAAGLLDLAGSAYASRGLPVAALLGGGLLFGFGMTLTGGCISKNLVRAGAGSLRALAVLLVVTATALPTLRAVRGLADGGLPMHAPAADSLGVAIGLVAAGGLVVFCLKDRRFRASRPLLVAGFTLGALIPLGWLATTWLSPGPAASLDYVAASAGSLDALLRGAAGAAFGLPLLLGTMLGSLVVASRRGRIRVEGFADGRDARRNLFGAALMGGGGALAGGCTVGQALSGLSTLAPASVLASGSIVLGAVAGIRTLEHGGVRGAWHALRAGG